MNYCESGGYSTVQEVLSSSMLNNTGELVDLVNGDCTYRTSLWWIYSDSKLSTGASE